MKISTKFRDRDDWRRWLLPIAATLPRPLRAQTIA
jgi:hypothetical protein